MKSARIPEHDSRDQAALFSGQAHVPLMPLLMPHACRPSFSIHFRKDLRLAGHRHFLSFRRFENSRNVEVPLRV
jgi:hypothetical protein